MHFELADFVAKSKFIYRLFLNIHYHVGVNNCAAKNFRKAAHFYALNATIHSFLTSFIFIKDLKQVEKAQN